MELVRRLLRFSSMLQSPPWSDPLTAPPGDRRTNMLATCPKAIGLTCRIHRDRAVRAARRSPTRGVMATDGFREEVLNVVLAQLLSERGLVSLPEAVLRSADGTRLPDVRVVFRGLHTSIEGKGFFGTPRLSAHGSIPSRVGASRKAGSVQLAVRDRS